MNEPYDSRPDTLAHIAKVSEYMDYAAYVLRYRGIIHDRSKLESPEKELLDKYTPILNRLKYGSEEYNLIQKELAPALDHHYQYNSHHPQHYIFGIDGMTLFDVIEMFFDWLAASKRTDGGSIEQSIEVSAERFRMAPQLKCIFLNTARFISEDDDFKEMCT